VQLNVKRIVLGDFGLVYSEERNVVEVVEIVEDEVYHPKSFIYIFTGIITIIKFQL
jgi:hypothetical protein